MNMKQEDVLEHVDNVNRNGRATQQHYEPTTDEEKSLERRLNFKLDLSVVLILAIGFILCGIDKTNIGFVATTSFLKDANLDENDIGNSLSLFSATYVPLQPFSTAMAHRLGPKYWIPLQLIAWGVICMAHAGIHNRATLIALRLLLGVAEAGFTQNALYYFSTMFPKYSVGWRMGLFTGMYSVAGAFAGLITYGLLQIETPQVRGWQYVFLLEGGLTILIGIIALFVLPKRLDTAWFLTPTERLHAMRRMMLDLAGTQETADISGGNITRRDILDVAKDWKKLLTVFFNMLAVLPVTAFTTFLPLIVSGMGYEGNQATLMSVPPFVAGVVGLLIIVYSSDAFHERSLHIICGTLLGMVGCIVMASTSTGQEKLRYGFVHVCMAGIFTAGPLVAAWLAGNTPWRGTRSVVLGVNGWSNLAGVIAGQLFNAKYAPGYKVPLTITVILMAVSMAGFFIIRLLYQRENLKRKGMIEEWTQDQFEQEAYSEELRGDQRHTFIYGL